MYERRLKKNIYILNFDLKKNEKIIKNDHDRIINYNL